MVTQNILNTLYLKILNVDKCSVQNWNFKKIISPFTRIYLVNGGEGCVVHNYRKYELRPGMLYLIPSFTLCNYESDSFLEHYYLHVVPKFGSGANVFGIFNFEYEVPANNNDITILDRILELNPGRKLLNLDPLKYTRSNLQTSDEPIKSSEQIAAYLETQGLLLSLFSRFLKSNSESSYNGNYCQNKNIMMAVDYIYQNLSKRIIISELAEICNLSKDYFSRLFLKTMGTRPVDFINRKRIESAQLLLITTDEPIEKIALETGIDNFPYFNRLFKKYSCNTPGQYKKLHRLV